MSQRPLSLREILNIVEHPAAAVALRCYCESWAGRRFESLGITDEPDPDRDVITAADIVAVRLLNVNIPSERIIDLLEGDLRRHLAPLLAGIPTHVDLGTSCADRLVVKGSHADHAWRLLEGKFGIGSVTAGKLLARKRPRLIPVFDRVVRCVFRPPKGLYGRWLDERLREDGGTLRLWLEKLHAELTLPNRLSPIRVLDVIVWMLHHRTHTNRSCPGFDLAEVPRQPDCATWRRRSRRGQAAWQRAGGNVDRGLGGGRGYRDWARVRNHGR